MNIKPFFVKLLLVQTYEQNNFEESPPAPVTQNDQTPVLQAPLPPSPDNPPWNNWAAMGVWITSVIFIVIFPNVFLLPYLAKQSLDFSNQAALYEFVKTDPTAILLQIASVFPAHLLTLLLAWLVVTNFRKYSFRQTLGWDWNGFKWWHSFAVVFIFFALNAILVSIFGEPENDFIQMLRRSRAAVFLVAILATFTAPIVEEVIYRGILYSSLKRSLGVVWAVVVVTFLFALVHVPQYSKDFVPDFQTVSLLLILSLTLTLIRVYTKNLLPCIILHTIFNGIQSLILIFEPVVRDSLDKQVPQQAASVFYFLK